MYRSVFIKKVLFDQTAYYCIEKKPYEACGFLLGSLEADTVYADEFIPVANVAENASVCFMMDPAAMIPIVTNTSTNKRLIVGVLHSHPTAAAIPSAEDLQSAWLHIPSHWIMSLQHDGIIDLQAYHYLENNLHDASGRTDSFAKVRYTSMALNIYDN
ncbi:MULTISPECIES: M67 family metallopeptidase [unclassified Paenibacillus]|uniref:M67 family metallopeptidase n=1 Tax=unclassified Paenibacillus TaxID=185978 RepID=UPI00363D4A19